MTELVIARRAALYDLGRALDAVSDAVLIVGPDVLETLGPGGVGVLRSEVVRRKLTAEFDPGRNEWRISRQCQQVEP